MVNTLTKSEPTANETTSVATGDTASQQEAETTTNTAALQHVRKRRWPWIVGLIAAAVASAVGIPWVHEMLTTVSTDDAYVNGHVTYVAPRVNGQVANVLVSDNNVVRKGDLLLELDTEPYQVQVNIAQAAVDAAKADLITAQAQVCGIEGQIRSLQFTMKHAIEDVDNKVAELRAMVAALDTAKAKLARADADYQRALSVQKANSGAISPQSIDEYKEAFRVAESQVNQALEQVHQIRVSLGLPATPPSETDLAEVPADLDQTFSGVREAQGKLMQAAAALGVSGPFDKLPHDMEKDFFNRYPNQDIDQIFAKLLTDAPDIKRAETKLAQAERNLDQAKLNLRYCKVYAEIDGAVTRKSVNPGNNVVTGQSVMAIRSVNNIWIDANFKETQLATLRIGQRVQCEVDMYGSRKEFEGRITGFTMGTGQTLALLPPQNATGNFVKIVQRLPVRIDLTDYDPDKAPLFVGLSVEPRVYYKEPPTGPNAGKVLQPSASASKSVATQQPTETIASSDVE
jgi:membrane fusion protein, multidrug efflux system